MQISKFLMIDILYHLVIPIGQYLSMYYKVGTGAEAGAGAGARVGA